MLPEWMQSKENYEPPAGGGSFVVKTIQTLGGIMSRVKIQKGHEKKRALPAIVKLAVLIVLIILTAACSRGRGSGLSVHLAAARSVADPENSRSGRALHADSVCPCHDLASFRYSQSPERSGQGLSVHGDGLHL